MRLENNLLIIYLFIVNVYAFGLYGLDKSKAKKGAWRISEKHLLLAAFLGGGLGALLGMKTFRHKTKHGVFKFGVPIMLCLQAGLLLYYFFGS